MGGRPEGGADRCGDMGYATTNGIELRIFCPAVKDMWVARRKIIDCSSKPFSTDLGPAVPGVIYPNVLATGKRSFRSMGKERSFRYFQAVGQRSRQRIHDD